MASRTLWRAALISTRHGIVTISPSSRDRGSHSMSQDPFVLAIDAAGAACSAAVAAGERLLAAERVESAHGQAEQLMPLIDRTMRRAGLAVAALDLIAATVGPGSFTGLRAGLAAARGIALASGRPLFGVTGFA